MASLSDGFHKDLRGFPVKCRLHFVYGAFEVGAGAELANELEGRSHGVKGRDLEHSRVIQIDRALILIFLQ